MQEQKPNIDQNALSRQLAVYGHQAQGKLMAMRVYIAGMTGVGIQVAKNLILAGPKQVSLYDPNPINIRQLGRNFYLKEEHVGKMTRAQASLPDLKELNTNVIVDVQNSNDINFITSNYECVVIVDCYDKNYIVNLNKACHEKNLAFILCGNLGLYGYTFVDFGENHKVFDATGQQEKSIHVAGISQQQIGVVYLHDEKKHQLNDGDTVTFREVKGMTQINDKQFKILVKTPHSFTIGDTRGFSPYVSGGIASEIKVPSFMKFYPLDKSLSYPYPPDSKQMPIATWQKFGYPEQLHVILNGVYNFWQKHKRLPKVLDQDQASQLVQFVNQWQKNKIDQEGFEFKVQQINENLVKNVAKFADTQISPCCSFWGGIITQQIVKLTGKYSPLRQWLHHEFFQVLPEDKVQRTIANTRYGDYNILFGDQYVRKSAESSSFLIGAGALGCEFIKMFALMGVSTSGKGRIACTDDDNIQISNLNRQFLFRKQHVGHNKSQVACQVGRKINKDARFESIKMRVGPESQQFFNDQFWTGLNFVTNAVDNIKARQYTDQQCVWYEKPLFESGTLGTKCHSQIIIPHHTQSYTDIVDPPEQSIPLCTLKNFPYQIQHCIQWARDYFQGTIAQPSMDLQKLYTNRQQFIANLLKQNRQNPTVAREKLQVLRRNYYANEAKSYQKCVQLSVNIFYDVFHNQIAQLLHAFPHDHIVEQTGKHFWSGLKRAPSVIQLDLGDPLHVQFIQAGANIFATIFGIPMQSNQDVIRKMSKSVTPVKFVAKKVHIQVDDKEKKDQPIQINQQDQIQIKKIVQQLSNVKLNLDRKPKPVQFEKDDPTNYHIQFMGGVSNLRARNYKIDEVDNFKVKLIAGKIIPAIATTTAMVVGAVGIQIIKFLLNKPHQIYKNVTINLALPVWVFNDPLEPIQIDDKEFDPIMCGPIKAVPGKFTKWDKIDIKGPMTIDEMKNHFQKTYNIEVSMITYGTSTVYSSYGNESKKRLNMQTPQAIESVTKKSFPKWRKIIPIGISGNTDAGIDCVLPDVRFHV